MRILYFSTSFSISSPKCSIYFVCVNVCMVREQKRSQFCSSVWVPEIEFGMSNLAVRIFACWVTILSCLYHFVTFKNNDRGSRDGSAIKSIGCSSGRSWFLQHSHCGSHPSEGLFWFLWAPGKHVVHTHTRRQNTPTTPTHKRIKSKRNKTATTKNNYRFLFIIFWHWFSQLQYTCRKKK